VASKPEEIRALADAVDSPGRPIGPENRAPSIMQAWGPEGAQTGLFEPPLSQAGSVRRRQFRRMRYLIERCDILRYQDEDGHIHGPGGVSARCAAEAMQDQALGELHLCAINGSGDVKKLGGREGYRLRSGRCRVIFKEDMTTVLAIHVGKRDPTTYR
jgi:mRNA interferase RelE/StbE